MSVPTFTAATLAPIIDGALTSAPGLHVLVAPTGSGKSTLTREHLVGLLATGRIRRVLWATQGTRDETSLGAEAQGHFRALDPTLDVQIVYGRNHLDTLGRGADYAGQFSWPAHPAVRIISHAHLPLVLGDSPTHSGLADADLVVIDEDPINALLISSLADDAPRFTAADLLSQPDATTQALGQMLRAAEDGHLDDYHVMQDIRGSVTGYSLSGDPFWETFDATLSGTHSDAGFKAALIALHPKQTRTVWLIADQFDLEYKVFRLIATPTDFGIHGDVTGGKVRFFFRYNVRRPLTLERPILVLDAYALPDQYRALFMEHDGRMANGSRVYVHPFAEGAPLRVEEAQTLRLDPTDDGTNRRVQNRRQIAEEVAAFRKAAASRGKLLLTPASMTRPESQWNGLLSSAFTSSGLTLGPDTTLGYWFAGRGQNEHAGKDVIALTAPHLPILHRDYDLSALFPITPADRQKLHDHLRASEHLQMLQRGRQDAGTGLPRVIAADLDDLKRSTLGHRIRVIPYRSTLHFKRGSPAPRWRDAVTAVSRDLLATLDGVPREALVAVGLVTTPRGLAKTSTAPAALHALALASRPNSHLHQAVLTRTTWLYGDVRPARDNNRAAEVEVMRALGLTAYTIAGRKGRPIVYARSETAAMPAATEFRRLGNP